MIFDTICSKSIHLTQLMFLTGVMAFKQLKSSKTLVLSAGILSASLLFASMPSSALAQDAGGQDGGESLPEEVEPMPEDAPAPEEVTPEAGETSSSVGSSAEPGSFACLNNPNPACEGGERNVAEDWASENNPGPDYAEPPRLGGTPLEPGSWACANNQNVVSCENPIRYTVEDKEAWPSRFPPAGERVSSGG